MAMQLRVRKQQNCSSSGGDWRVQRLMGARDGGQAHSETVLVVETGMVGERGGISMAHGSWQAGVRVNAQGAAIDRSY